MHHTGLGNSDPRVQEGVKELLRLKIGSVERFSGGGFRFQSVLVHSYAPGLQHKPILVVFKGRWGGYQGWQWVSHPICRPSARHAPVSTVGVALTHCAGTTSCSLASRSHAQRHLVTARRSPGPLLSCCQRPGGTLQLHVCRPVTYCPGNRLPIYVRHIREGQVCQASGQR